MPSHIFYGVVAVYKKWRDLARLIVAVVLVSGGALYLVFQVRYAPIVERAAVLKVENDAAGVINNAIESVIADGKVDYNQLIFLDKDGAGNVTALKTNMAAVNQLKFEILDTVSDNILELSSEKITIPAGSVFLPELFSGWGPDIPIRLVALRASNAQFESQFSAAGINQTRHQILVSVSVDITIMTPAGTCEVPVVSNAVVAETIIVGAVPETFVAVGGNGG